MNRSRPGGNSKPNSVRASFLSPVQERFETDEVCVASSCSGPALFQTILERRSTKLWKKCRLRAENAATRQSQVQPTLPKSPHYWEILSLFIDGEMQAAGVIGGGRGTGIEPSPRSPEQSRVPCRNRCGSQGRYARRPAEPGGQPGGSPNDRLENGRSPQGHT